MDTCDGNASFKKTLGELMPKSVVKREDFRVEMRYGKFHGLDAILFQMGRTGRRPS
jgi:hypothetical protein